jgi:hypothetical protein
MIGSTLAINRSLALCALIACGPVPAVSGQQAGTIPPGRAGARGAAGPAASLAELQTMFDGYVLMQAQEALQVTDEQFPRFLARLKALQEVRRRGQAERARAIQELRRLTQQDGTVEESALRARLKALDDVDARAAADVKQAHAALEEVMSVTQQARFRVFEETMERRKVELLMRARQANRQNRF